MSNDPKQPDHPDYPSPYEASPYGQQGQPYYPPPPPQEQSSQPPPPPLEKTQLASPSPYVTPPSGPSSAYPPQYGTIPSGQYAQPAYPPQYGVPAYGQPPARKSRRLLWIILGAVALFVILLVGGIIGLVVLVVSHSPATDAVNGYYSAIKSQNYTQAYSYLDPNLKLRNSAQTALTQDVFVQGLQQIDQQKGKVSNYSITSTNLNSTNGTSNGSYTVSVTRNGAAYNVHLVLQQENGQWKITSFDTV